MKSLERIRQLSIHNEGDQGDGGYRKIRPLSDREEMTMLATSYDSLPTRLNRFKAIKREGNRKEFQEEGHRIQHYIHRLLCTRAIKSRDRSYMVRLRGRVDAYLNNDDENFPSDPEAVKVTRLKQQIRNEDISKFHLADNNNNNEPHLLLRLKERYDRVTSPKCEWTDDDKLDLRRDLILVIERVRAGGLDTGLPEEGQRKAAVAMCSLIMAECCEGEENEAEKKSFKRKKKKKSVAGSDWHPVSVKRKEIGLVGNHGDESWSNAHGDQPMSRTSQC